MFPIAFLTLAGVLEAIDSTLEDASLDLNASRWQTFARVTLPLAAPGILSAWLLVFTNSLADFANPCSSRAASGCSRWSPTSRSPG